jgi:hypothetical protein
MYYCADISWPVSFTLSAWERVCATNCRENIRRLAAGKQLARGNSTQHLLITAILLAQRLTSYWGNIVSLRMLINLKLANLASDYYASEIHRPKSTVPAIKLSQNHVEVDRLTTLFQSLLKVPASFVFKDGVRTQGCRRSSNENAVSLLSRCLLTIQSSPDRHSMYTVAYIKC